MPRLPHSITPNRQPARPSFELSRGPLIRGCLLQLAEQQHRLLIGMHHSISDGWSIGILIRELGALYAAFVQGQPRLLIGMHHSISDGWSIGILIRELGALYAAFVQGQPNQSAAAPADPVRRLQPVATPRARRTAAATPARLLARAPARRTRAAGTADRPPASGIAGLSR